MNAEQRGSFINEREISSLVAFGRDFTKPLLQSAKRLVEEEDPSIHASDFVFVLAARECILSGLTELQMQSLLSKASQRLAEPDIDVDTFFSQTPETFTESFSAFLDEELDEEVFASTQALPVVIGAALRLSNYLQLPPETETVLLGKMKQEVIEWQKGK